MYLQYVALHNKMCNNNFLLQNRNVTLLFLANLPLKPIAASSTSWGPSCVSRAMCANRNLRPKGVRIGLLSQINRKHVAQWKRNVVAVLSNRPQLRETNVAKQQLQCDNLPSLVGETSTLPSRAVGRFPTENFRHENGKINMSIAWQCHYETNLMWNIHFSHSNLKRKTHMTVAFTSRWPT